jgi:hypothetical protein
VYELLEWTISGRQVGVRNWAGWRWVFETPREGSSGKQINPQTSPCTWGKRLEQRGTRGWFFPVSFWVGASDWLCTRCVYIYVLRAERICFPSRIPSLAEMSNSHRFDPERADTSFCFSFYSACTAPKLPLSPSAKPLPPPTAAHAFW